MESTKVTPMMQQYLQIKERYRDAILFFRLGDFYEMFFEDAHTASKILDIALTSRNKSDESSVPLCGVPYHSAEPYIQKLLDAGHKVAVCEQVEDPATAKGVVKREVVRVITPGTVTAAEALDAHVNNFLAAVSKGEGGFGLAVTDITTGEFRFTEVAGELALFDELSRIQPSELLLGSRETRLRERLYKEFPLIHFTAVLDEATRANLELVSNSQGDRKGSLLAILDCTLTSMGARRLRQWLLYPLLDEQAIRERHDGVQELVEHFALRQELTAGLAKIQDLERLAGRVVSGSAVPKDLVAIKDTLRGV